MSRRADGFHACRAPAPFAALLLAAATGGGCMHAFLEPAGKFEDFAYDYEAGENGLIPRSRLEAPASRAPDLLGTFGDRLADRVVARAHEPRPSALADHLAMAGTPDAYALSANPDHGMLGAEIQREVAKEVGQEFRKLGRKALIEAIRCQPAWQQIHGVVAIEADDTSPFGYSPGRLRGTEDGAEAGAYAWTVNGPWLDTPDPGDVAGSLSVGVRPRLGLKWMRAYQIKWDAREQELTHRLEYRVGPFGTAAEYRLEEGNPALAGFGIYKPLGPMSLLSLSASRGLQDVEPNNDRSYFAELFCRF